MTQQTLWVYPAVEDVRQQLFQKLFAWQAIATSHPRIQSSRYQVRACLGAASNIFVFEIVNFHSGGFGQRRNSNIQGSPRKITRREGNARSCLQSCGGQNVCRNELRERMVVLSVSLGLAARSIVRKAGRGYGFVAQVPYGHQVRLYIF